MNEHVVTYDLYSPGQNYKILTEKLKKYPCYVHLQRSVWVIQTSETVEQVERKLSSCLDSNDRLFVAQLNGETAVIYPRQQTGTTMLTRW